jgi:hypothetical protein
MKKIKIAFLKIFGHLLKTPQSHDLLLWNRVARFFLGMYNISKREEINQMAEVYVYKIAVQYTKWQ